MQKNVAGQKLIAFAFDSTTNLPRTGDAANLTAYVSKDYGAVTVLGDTTATEMDATNAKGYYLFDLTQAETNADTLLFSAKSGTANIVVIGVPATVFTTPPNFSLASIDANGRVDVIKVAGTSQTARDLGGQLDAAVTTRMATYTQPTGFLAATFPGGTIANTTNITAAAGVALAANQHVIVDSGTVTTLTNLPAIPANWITAAGITAAALNGKGDWLTAVGYTAPDNSGIASITAKLPANAIADETLVIAATNTILTRLGTPAGASVSADVAAIPAAVWAFVVENGKTALQFLRIIKASAAGKLAGAATATVTVRDDADTKNRITATVDADGNRTAVTTDGT